MACHDFVCAAVHGLVYAVGWHGVRGENFQVLRVFGPQNRWILIAKDVQMGLLCLLV